MRRIYFCSVLGLVVMGCTTTPNNLPEQATAAPIEASQRLRYQLNTQGLPASGFWKSAPVLADINHDGRLDLASHSRDDKSPRVWLSQPQNAWQDSSQGLSQSSDTCGGGLKIGDINKDSFLDLAIADHCAGVLVYLGNKQNTWQLAKQLNSEAQQKTAAINPGLNVLNGAADLALGDINEDGLLDIVSAAADEGGFTVYLGKSNGKKWRETKSDGLPSIQDPGNEDSNAGWAVDVQLHDINNDKHLDIVASYYNGPRVWLGDGKGQWQPKSIGLPITTMQGTYRRLAVADINADGLKDFAIANDIGGAEAYLQNADGSWKKSTDILPALKAGATAIALGDMDGDGHIDAVIGGRLDGIDDTPAGLHIVLGDGKGQWHYEQGTQLPASGIDEVWGLALSDLNGDQRLDIVASTGYTARPSKNNPKKPNDIKLPSMQVWLSQPVNTSVATPQK